MRSPIAICALLPLVLGVPSAFADDNKPVKGETTQDDDTAIASKIIGNGRGEDRSECDDAMNSADCEIPSTANADTAKPVRPSISGSKVTSR